MKFHQITVKASALAALSAALLKEREMLNAEQRLALANLLLKQDPRNTAGAQQMHAR